MKFRLSFAPVAGALLLLFPLDGRGQSAVPAPPGPDATPLTRPPAPFAGPGRPGGPLQRPWMRRNQGGPNGAPGQLTPRQIFLQSLTPQERQQFRAARQAAMRDPVVQAAFATREADRRAFREAMRSALLKADPSLAPTIERLEKSVREQRGAQMKKFEQRLGFLSPEERMTLLRARQAVQADAGVAAARQQRDAATFPEARQQAARIYNEAVKNAMIRQDPQVGQIIEKVRQQRPPVVPIPPRNGPPPGVGR